MTAKSVIMITIIDIESSEIGGFGALDGGTEVTVGFVALVTGSEGGALLPRSDDVSVIVMILSCWAKLVVKVT